jgi:predicted SnoaL-like aldol condensation-catalyzing enzyme
MSVEDNKQVVARFVEVCQNQHDLAAADGMFHPQFVNHSFPGGRPLPATSRPAESFQRYYGMFLAAFPDATMQIEEQIAEGDLVVTRKTFRGTHLGEQWRLPPYGQPGAGRVHRHLPHPGRPTGGALAPLRLRGAPLPDAVGADWPRHATAGWKVLTACLGPPLTLLGEWALGSRSPCSRGGRWTVG